MERIRRLGRLVHTGVSTAGDLAWLYSLGGGFLIWFLAVVGGFVLGLPWPLFVPLGLAIGLLAWAALIALHGNARAIHTLKPYATEYSRTKIVVFPAYQIPLARKIADLFDLAGWTTDFNETPQEFGNPTYVEGVEVSGPNRHLVGVVRSALSHAKIEGLRETVTENRIARGNPKYQSAVGSVRVTIGHTTKVVR